MDRESKSSIMNRFADEIIKQVAIALSNGDGNTGAKEKIRGQLSTVFDLGRQDMRCDLLIELNNIKLKVEKL